MNILDKKEESVDLSPTELEIRIIMGKNLDDIYHREELSWKQQAMITWFKEGDRNTSFFL